MGKKSKRNVGQLYPGIKKKASLVLTDEALSILVEFSGQLDLSKSELVERLIRVFLKTENMGALAGSIPLTPGETEQIRDRWHLLRTKQNPNSGSG